jgi:hypothetical protein
VAIYIPIVTELKSDGIDKAKKEFKSLEGVGAKAQYAIKKAAVPAAAALGGLAVILGDATKGAIEDAAAQEKLAGQLQRTTKATDAQISANEDWISTQGSLRAFSDSELRPALAKLATVTGDIEKSQKGAIMAMDIAAATGKPLESVTNALAKAYGGNLTALSKLDPSLRDLVKSGASADEVFGELEKKFGGAAEAAAGTAEGSMKKLSIAFDETKESVGAALLPVLEKLLPYLTKFADWAQKNPTVFLAIAGAIGGIALAITAVNIAMALNPVTGIVLGVMALVAALGLAYKKFEGFRNVVDTVFGAIKWYIFNVTIPGFKMIATVFRAIFNTIATVWNNTVGKLSFKIPGWVPGIGGKGFSVPQIPLMGGGSSGGPDTDGMSDSRITALASGGIVTSPTLSLIGEAGPEAVIPLDRLGDMGGGGNVTIMVNGGDPNAVVDALRRYYRQNGPLPVGVAY